MSFIVFFSLFGLVNLAIATEDSIENSISVFYFGVMYLYCKPVTAFLVRQALFSLLLVVLYLI